jgi:hypothetical protein
VYQLGSDISTIFKRSFKNQLVFSKLNLLFILAMREKCLRHVYKFGDNNFGKMDINNNGALEMQEFKNVISAFAATDSRIVFSLFDADGNNNLDLSRNELNNNY